MVLGVVGMLLVMPVIQLLSAGIAFLIFVCGSRPDKFQQLRQVGKITLGVVLGSGVGIGVMVALGFVLAGFSSLR